MHHSSILPTVDADGVIDAVRSAAIEYFSKVVLQHVLAWGGFFSWTIVQTVTGLIVRKVIEIAILKTELGIYVLYANERADRQAREYEEARQAESKLPPDASEIERAEARKRVIDTARDLVRWTR